MAELRAIDCDVHPTVPDNKALLPYLKRYSDATPQNGTGYVYIGDFMQDHGHVWVFLRK